MLAAERGADLGQTAKHVRKAEGHLINEFVSFGKSFSTYQKVVKFCCCCFVFLPCMSFFLTYLKPGLSLTLACSLFKTSRQRRLLPFTEMGFECYRRARREDLGRLLPHLLHPENPWSHLQGHCASNLSFPPTHLSTLHLTLL